MDEILQSYKQGKFRKCLQLINLLPEKDDVVENFAIDNCKLVCEALVTLSESDPDKIYETQEQLYLLFDRVTSTGMLTAVPTELQVTVTFNLILWLLLYNDAEINEFEVEEYFELVNKGLLRVLGRQVSCGTSLSAAENVLENLWSLRKLMAKDQKTVMLVLELVIVVVLYVIKLERKLLRGCLRVVDMFITECRGIRAGASVREFMEVDSQPLCLFKFGLKKTAGVLSESDSSAVDHLHLLQAVILHLLGDFKGSLKSLQGSISSSVKSLWSYLVALNAFELENWDLCLGFLDKLTDLVLQTNLRVRLHVMRGKLHCVKRDHKEAVREFEDALKLSGNCPLVYYYVGQEYGRMGIQDLMVESFEKLVKVIKDDDLEEDFKPNFETVVLDWIHPPDEITEGEAYYSLAIAYGLNEDFKKAGEAFERVLESPPREKSIVELPDPVTLLHEAAIMNLLSGNLVRAEQITWDAIDRYLPREPPRKRDQKGSLLAKDVEWLQKTIHQELLESDLEPRPLSENILYSEELTFGFPKDVIGLLTLSEIQRIEEVDDYKATLNSVFSLFSKCMASTHNKDVEEDEEHALTLIKALAGKTCLRIASEQMKLREDASVEKMFKRALSCNKGDKEALCSYYAFLLQAGRRKEALKLWRTFSPHKETVSLDAVQSFSLRYFLKDKITRRELMRIQREVESTDARLC